MVSAAVLIPEPAVTISLDVADILAPSVSHIFTILAYRFSAITVSHPAIVVFTSVAHIVAIFTMGGAASSSILSADCVSRDQNEPECKSR
jgi:hypothetical protein